MQTVDEYLGEVYRVIRENFASSDPTGGMTAAVAGFLVKQLIDRDHLRFGFLRLEAALEELERRKFIRTGVNSKNALSIWLLPRPGQPVLAAATPPISQGFRPLRKAVWLAFVTPAPSGRRFFNRASGEVKQETQDGLETDPSWVEIVPLDVESDRTAALDFLRQNGVDNADILASVNSDRWYTDLRSEYGFILPCWPRGGSVTDLTTSSESSGSGVRRMG